MGLLADDVRVDRRAGLRALLILVVLLAVGFGSAWLTIGRSGRFQSLKGVFLSFELPRAFTQIDEEGEGGSLSSLGDEAQIERTFAVTLPPKETCRVLSRRFRAGGVAMTRAPVQDPGLACSFSGPVGDFSLQADVRDPAAFMDHLQANEKDIVGLPRGTRSVTSMLVGD